MATVEREKTLGKDSVPTSQVNIVELHLYVGFPFFVFGPVMEGARAAERGLKGLFSSEPASETTNGKKRVAA